MADQSDKVDDERKADIALDFDVNACVAPVRRFSAGRNGDHVTEKRFDNKLRDDADYTDCNQRRPVEHAVDDLGDSRNMESGYDADSRQRAPRALFSKCHGHFFALSIGLTIDSGILTICKIFFTLNGTQLDR